MKTIITTALIILVNFGYASEGKLTQTIRGKVIDEDTRQSIIGANIIVLNSEPFKGTTTDLDGNFTLIEVPVGRVSIQISFLGYETKTMSNLVVSSAKELILDVSMVESVTTLKAAEILAVKNRGEVQNEMATVSARSFSVDETGRYAGSFNDPTRMASAFAGVVADAEGNNDVRVRGNSPKGILWRLEGMEVPNPNHFVAEGASGGPISILNADMLDNSEFYTGAFPAEYGNAFSGVFDISFRKGNNQQHEFAAGISALGVDVTAEGPLSIGKNASYIANYRYSSLAILSDLGVVDFGGVPKYQDAAFKVFVPTENAGTFSLYGMGGINGIAQEYYDSSETNVLARGDFNSGMGVAGLNHFISLGKKAYLKSSAAVSTTFSESIGSFKDENNEWYDSYDDSYATLNTRLATQLNYKLSSKHKIQSGIVLSNLHYDYDGDYNFEDGRGLINILSEAGDAQSLQAYSQWKYRPTANLDLNIGFHHIYFALNDKHSFEPRLGAKWGFAPKHYLTAGAGLHSKLEPIATYIADYKRDAEIQKSPNEDLEIMKAAHAVLGYEFYPSSVWKLKAETYYQYLYDVPVGVGNYSFFSSLNQNEWFIDFPKENAGLGRNYGIEFSAERFFSKSWYALTTISVYQAEYQDEFKKWKSTRYNGNYTVNLLAGKEFTIGKKKDKTNILGLSAKLGYIGGGRHTPLDLEASRASFSTELDRTKMYEAESEDIFFLNTNIYYKINQAKVTHEFKLDIQNATNNLAKVRPYYDEYADQVEYTTQLGFLPNLSYRIFF